MLAMIYYGNPSTEAIRDAMAAGRLGCIVGPGQGNITFPDEWDVIADNGCFSASWTYPAWRDWLLDRPRSYRFAVCPDVYHPDGRPSHDETLERWDRHAPMMRRHGFTPAFVCQIGCTVNTIPFDADILFLGGTTDWKLGAEAHRITAAAKADDRWVHMGRVNSGRRLRTARDMGCDSVDGTYLTYGPDKNLARLLRFLDRTERDGQMPLELFSE